MIRKMEYNKGLEMKEKNSLDLMQDKREKVSEPGMQE